MYTDLAVFVCFRLFSSVSGTALQTRSPDVFLAIIDTVLDIIAIIDIIDSVLAIIDSVWPRSSSIQSFRQNTEMIETA